MNELNLHTTGNQNEERWSKLKKWIIKRKKIIILVIFIIAILPAFYIAYLRYFAKSKPISGSDKNKVSLNVNYQKDSEIKKSKSLLDNVEYPENVSNRHPLAIMVENHTDARPQAGLDKAKIVYEAITEGGITRFMAIFGPESASKVGPVRSARTFYLDWALEYDAFYAHVGGNLDALQLIPKISIKDLDQFRYGQQAYWREPESGKATEHTMYTDTDKLWQIAQNNHWDLNANFESYKFKDDISKDQRPESASVVIEFSSQNYKVSWTYDREANNYVRKIADIEQKDAVSKQPLTAKNVIIQEVERWNAPTEIGEAGWAMKTVGSGNAKILLDGKEIDATWKKTDRASKTKFYLASDNKEIEFNSGNTWFEIVPPDISVIIQ